MLFIDNILNDTSDADVAFRSGNGKARSRGEATDAFPSPQMALSRLPANIVRNFDLKLPCAPFRGLANCHVVAEYHYGTSNDLRYHSVTVGRGPRRLFLLDSPDFRKAERRKRRLTSPCQNITLSHI